MEILRKKMIEDFRKQIVDMKTMPKIDTEQTQPEKNKGNGASEETKKAMLISMLKRKYK
jgi:hypothetical protein